MKYPGNEPIIAAHVLNSHECPGGRDQIVPAASRRQTNTGIVCQYSELRKQYNIRRTASIGLSKPCQQHNYKTAWIVEKIISCRNGVEIASTLCRHLNTNKGIINNTDMLILTLRKDWFDLSKICVQCSMNIVHKPTETRLDNNWDYIIDACLSFIGKKQ